MWYFLRKKKTNPEFIAHLKELDDQIIVFMSFDFRIYSQNFNLGSIGGIQEIVGCRKMEPQFVHETTKSKLGLGLLISTQIEVRKYDETHTRRRKPFL